MLKTANIMLACAAFLIQSNAVNARTRYLTAAELVREYSDTEVRPLTTMYVIGLIKGLNAYNMADNFVHGKKLYCLPSGLNLTSDQVVSMIEDLVDDKPELSNEPDTLALLLALRKVFPCTGS